uniref:Uncharacterized protein n=1 Tax=Steinernema glaseri TaxID=37863 RepID=A0A1I8A4S8_9BILA
MEIDDHELSRVDERRVAGDPDGGLRLQRRLLRERAPKAHRMRRPETCHLLRGCVHLVFDGGRLLRLLPSHQRSTSHAPRAEGDRAGTAQAEHRLRLLQGVR